MKTITLRIFMIVCLLVTFGGISQTLNQPANWPNPEWTLAGTYTPGGLLGDPTSTDSTLTWDDDTAGNGSADDIRVTSPVIDLTAASSNGETEIIVSGDNVYRALGGDRLEIEVFDADAMTWSSLERFAGNSATNNWRTCSGTSTYITPILDISGFTPTQLSGFKYRMSYDDNNGWQWGFCLTSPTISSAAPPLCADPGALTATNATPNGADLGWTENGTATMWDVEILTSTTPPTGTPTNTGVANPFTANTLAAETNYDFFVRANCGIGATSDWVGPFTFRTACAAIAAPYTEDFETFTTSDVAFVNENCWTGTGGAYYWESAPGTDVGSGGTGPDPSITTGNYFYTEASNGSNGDVTDLVTPNVDLTALTAPSLAFNYHMFGVQIGTLDVLVNGTTNVFSISGQQQATATTLWDLATIDLSAYAGQTISITFRGTSAGTFEGDMAIDNVAFGELPTCPDPSALGATMITTTTADLGWTENGITTLWDVEIVDITAGGTVTGIATDTGVANPYTATGLVQNNDYEFYVQADCGVNGSSGWVGPFAFSTIEACPVPSALFTSNVTETAADLNWTENGTATSWNVELVDLTAGGVFTGTATATGVTNPYAATGLVADNLYQFYVQSDCGIDGVSDWAGTFTFATAYVAVPPDCTNGIFLDSGGKSSNYSSGENITYTICPDNPGDVVSIDFTTFSTENNGVAACWDGLTIHNGADALASTIDPPGGGTIWCWDRNDTPQVGTGDLQGMTIVSTDASGCITFVFTSDGTTTREGWDAIVSCVPGPSCLQPTDLNVTNIVGSTATLGWTDANAPASASFDIEFRVAGDVPTGVPTFTGVLGNSFAFNGISLGGQYEFYVRADCGGGPGPYSDWAGPFAWTQISIAGGIDCVSAVTVFDGPHASQIVGDGSNNTGDDLWFVYFSTSGGTLDINSCNSSNKDTRLNVYAECGDFIGHNDPGNNPIIVSDDDCGLSSQVNFDVVANQYYYFQWDDRWGEDVFNWDISFTPACTGITTLWDGTSWRNGVPGPNDYVIIEGGETYNTFDDGNLDVCSLQVDGTLQVELGTFAKTGGDINVTPFGLIEVGPQGSIVQVDDTAATNNDGTIQLLTQTPNMAAQSFMISGSPMTDETREGVFGPGYIVRNHVTANFLPHPDVEVLAPGLNNWADDDGNNWLPHTGGLNPGEGYMVFPQAGPGSPGGMYTQTHTLGTLNNGVVQYNMGFNANQNVSPSMMANPYPSAIDAELFFDDPANSDIDAVYFWEHLTAVSAGYPGYNVANFNMGDISVYSESMGAVAAANGGGVPSQFISTGQGFGVKPAAGGIAQFNNAMRVTGNNDTYRLNTVNRDRLWMHVYNDTYGLGSTALIGFSENTGDGYNTSEDIDRIPTPVSLYSELATGEELVINALDTFETEDAFYMSFSTQVKETQSYRISIQDMDGINFENVSVYLIDSLTGTVTNLTEGDYSFVSGEAVYNKRFKVVFDSSNLGVNDSNLDSVSLYPNPTQNIVTIVSPKTIVVAATVYDIRGRIVSEVDFRNQTVYRVDLSAMEAAIYFIDIATESGVVNKRVIKVD